MQNEWILDVLTDLRTFARQNGLGALADQLDETSAVARADLTSQPKGHGQDDGGAVPVTFGPHPGCVDRGV